MILLGFFHTYLFLRSILERCILEALLCRVLYCGHSTQYGHLVKTCNHGTEAPTFWPMSIVVKQLDGSACHLVWTMEVGVGPDHIVLDGNPAAT